MTMSSAIIATFILKEKFLKIHALGVSLIIAGVVLIVYSKGNEAVIEPTIEEALTEYFGSTQSIIYCISICSITVFLLFICETHGKAYVIFYTSLCSLIASWTVLGCKSFMAFFRRTVEKGDNQLTRMPEGLFAWFTLLVVVACAVISLHYLQQAMRYHDNNKVIPTYYATFTLACIIGAAVVYKEFEGLTVRQLSLFFLGLVLAGAGVFTISAKRAHEEGEDTVHEEKRHENGVSKTDSWDRWARNGDRLKLVEMDMLKAVHIENGDFTPTKSPHTNGS
ncbi:hypothetical protein GUITHDRAFT_165739 [Guillardia theta CCMP2712]|uniref:Magnesium transporter n=1 Tax=Guillardia theta (strain CCMP2712) TaxID=905079 RepID=L1IJP9_GUITC|nr:hypothetical protein GUITHDRAFT_165739 [Guillardia theta CCMP2712]EKX36461.1 hypothetical protein GUITHDRAFT_165739 [Guillardia theta CCMP2712]|eukprot:XP_005823441.1 hypothetical protein GUITHDRAFT_165739 [Guillardia theta CCMP2712]